MRRTLNSRWLVSFFAPLSFACIGAGANLPTLETAKDVDLSRYVGRWYEIAKYPVIFEAGCVNVTADYAIRDDGAVDVVNTCGQTSGEPRTINGFATADADDSAKLTVYFFYPFGAPYWILEVGGDYEYAVVGDPTRSYFWILSRTPQLDDDTYNSILEKMPDWGYDPNRLELMPQGV
ncbi:MAG TPA: lipocalin family protein [Phycisphaerae bacterium]|nr:lipocalin family protein [Phycisphaerae bacterium]HRW52505.1 lipocalin family protein [Phycisphaerae bacterium]